MKTSYKIAVGTSSVVVAPDISIHPNTVSDFVAGGVSQGDYVKNTLTGRIYWAINAGTAVTMPNHMSGITTHESIEWLQLVISADRDIVASVSKGPTAIADEGTILDVSSPAWDLGGYLGQVSAIADASGYLSVEHGQG